MGDEKQENTASTPNVDTNPSDTKDSNEVKDSTSSQPTGSDSSSSTPAGGSQSSPKPAESTQPAVKKPSGTFNVLRTQHRHVDGKKDENYEVRSQPEGAYNTNKPLSDRTARTADEIAEAYLYKHFKDFKNESNLTAETSLTIYTYEKDKGANLTTQRVLGDVVERALRDKYRKFGFKNVERAKSAIAFIYGLKELKSLKEITPLMKNRAIQAILAVYPELTPKEKEN